MIVEFNTTLNCDHKILKQILTDYEKLTKYLPRQLTELKILEKQDNTVIIESTIMFKTLIKKEIKQTIKIKENDNKLNADVLDGHAKGTAVLISITPNNKQTQINIEIDLKLSLKAKILTPIIKREYKTLLVGLFTKMELDAQKLEVQK